MVLIVIEHASQRKIAPKPFPRFLVGARALCRAGTWSLRGSGRALGGVQFRSEHKKTGFVFLCSLSSLNTKTLNVGDWLYL